VILSDVKRYLEQRGQATLADLAMHFDAEPDVLRAMLEVWIGKGRVERSTVSADCGGSCTRCAPEAREIYRWKGQRMDAEGRGPQALASPPASER
jgi:hypothetical protein